MDPCNREVSVDFVLVLSAGYYIPIFSAETSQLDELSKHFERLTDAEGKAAIFLKLLEMEQQLAARIDATARIEVSPPKLPLSLPVNTAEEFQELEGCLETEEGKDILVRRSVFSLQEKEHNRTFPLYIFPCF